ncbi:thioredoxin, mitochondrial-like [Agrilus planipennis]|uniref:Thioredoxin, mitochondrial-like n=1 Tax=Agrilus planipennis TaxID=224129 RepID=A0A1W4XCG8_AGRPL|nr:thioredoxin, mitochondrial-like [Agrilus planipennis]
MNLQKIVRNGQILKGLTNIGKRNFSTSFIRRGTFKVQDEEDFSKKVEESKEPVIVDFFATWCGPCKALEPRLENIVAKRKGQINVAKVDIDSLGELAAKYEVSTIPALVAFRNGKVEERLVGLQDEDKLNNWVDKILNRK